MNVNSAFVYYSNAVASDDERVTQSAFMRIMLSVVSLRIGISVRDWQYTGAQRWCFIQFNQFNLFIQSIKPLIVACDTSVGIISKIQ